MSERPKVAAPPDRGPTTALTSNPASRCQCRRGGLVFGTFLTGGTPALLSPTAKWLIAACAIPHICALPTSHPQLVMKPYTAGLALCRQLKCWHRPAPSELEPEAHHVPASPDLPLIGGC